MKRSLPFIVLILLSLVMVTGFYYRVIFSPNDYMFSDSGDGIKNYFTYYYHIKHDSTYIDFEGMNYPYGEHFLYTDCHPLLANNLKWLAQRSPFFADFSIGILNLLMILSIFLTFLVMYWILFTFGVNRWLSIAIALGIGLLAPQVFRMQGHLALSYSVAIPITWGLLILSRKYVNERLFILMILVNNLLWLFIHAYLGMILIAFQFAFLLCFILVYRNYRKEAVYYLSMAAAIIVPVFFFYGFASFTDERIDRTDNPSGFFLYNAELDDLFLAHHPPLRPVLDELTGNSIKQEWEGWAYIGLTNTLIFVFVFAMVIAFALQKRKRKRVGVFFKSKLLNVSLMAAVIVLFFAMAFPFRQFPQLLETFPVFKQFRATGRFAWVFYFVATVYGATILQKGYLWLKKRSRARTGMAIAMVGALFMIIEGAYHHAEVARHITRSPNLFRTEMLSGPMQNALDRIDAEKYQAILPLPFYYQGSESYTRPRQDETVTASMVISAHTGLPILGANLTRTSISESKRIVQVVTPNLYPKPLMADLKDDRPFLVVRSINPITAYESIIFGKCDTLYHNPQIALYTIEKDQLFGDYASEILARYNTSETYPAACGMLTTDTAAYLYFNDFDQTPADHVFAGDGAYQGEKRGKNVLAAFESGTFQNDQAYHISIWMFNGYKDALNLWFRFIIEEHDEGQGQWYETTFFPDQSEVINGNWSLAEGTFRIRNSGNKVYIVTKGKENAKPPFIADDLLIITAETDVYRWTSDSTVLFYNNHRFNLQSKMGRTNE